MIPTVFMATLGSRELVNLVADTTFFGKGILLILLAISVTSWAVLIDKARLLASYRAGHLEFWKRCDRWLDGGLGDDEFKKWCTTNSQLPCSALVLETTSCRSVSGVRRTAERVAYAEVENMERYLIVLSTAVTIAPFIGLLGTVWGIMTSFWDMSTMRSANLTVVAPGIADALITTVAGLATAIPAVVFYNTLVRKIDLVGNEMERLRTVLEENVAGHGRSPGNGSERQPARRPEFQQRKKI